MNDDQLYDITQYIKEHVWLNDNVIFERADMITDTDIETLVDIISSLHNLLYEEVTGERYDYAFHWCNKSGGSCNDDIFNDILEVSTERHNIADLACKISNLVRNNIFNDIHTCSVIKFKILNYMIESFCILNAGTSDSIDYLHHLGDIFELLPCTEMNMLNYAKETLSLLSSLYGEAGLYDEIDMFNLNNYTKDALAISMEQIKACQS